MKSQRAQKLRYPKPADQRKPSQGSGVSDGSRQSAPAPLPKTNKIQKPLKGGLGSKPLIATAPNPAKVMFKQLTIDTETTGNDFWHGCRPFFVSTCDEDGNVNFWEWDVNPLTRSVGYYISQPNDLKTVPGRLEDSPYGRRSFVAAIPPQDKRELTQLISNHHFILHNTKYDVRALESVNLPRINLATVQDTLIASHVVRSNESHKLKDLALQYLNINDDDQSELREATKEARSIARGLGWAIASDGGHPCFPAQRSAPKEGWWVFDTWLPRAIAKYKWEVEGNESYAPSDSLCSDRPNWRSGPGDRDGHPWWTVLSTYGVRDVERTLGLWWYFRDSMEHNGLMECYEERRRNLEAVYEMEQHGATVSKKKLSTLQRKLTQESAAFHDRCLEIADYKLDNLNSSRQVEGVLFGNFGIRPGKRTKGAMEGKTTGQQYAVSNDVLLKLLDRTEGEYREFIWKLLGYRAREKSTDYLEEYTLRGVPDGAGWITLHGSFNITGTDTPRLSSSGPNLQNVGKGGKRPDDPVPSLRSIFGPKPGREWYSIDFSNIEMRIFAYKSGDPQLINAFETGYSVHLIFAELLYEDQWASCVKEARTALFQEIPRKLTPELDDKIRRSAGKLFKQHFEASYYQWCKNGNFALIYGAGRDRADTTYHRPGAYDVIRSRLPLIDEFMSSKDHEARTYGYVTLDSGYRLFVPPQEPHVAVNYYVQGNAAWCMTQALNRVHNYLKSLNEQIRKAGPKAGEPAYKMIMTIHDELDFDFPKHPRNKEVITKIGEIMANTSQFMNVPTPVEIELHASDWSKGVAL
jgi:DNA polymerase I-like protein with 3'-5' exonuclease and polymerase domains